MENLQPPVMNIEEPVSVEHKNRMKEKEAYDEKQKKRAYKKKNKKKDNNVSYKLVKGIVRKITITSNGNKHSEYVGSEKECGHLLEA